MADPVDGFLEEWHRAVREKNVEALRGLLAPNASIGAPPYWQRIEGSDLVAHLLGVIVRTIDDFTYHRQWRNGSELALEFTGRVGDLDLQGIDLISVNDEGLLAKIDVPMRPMNAVQALQKIVAPQVMAFLKERA
jgi:hypothetical protein